MLLIKPEDLIEELGVEGLCQTADVYFEGFDLSLEQMRKPFSNLGDAPRLLRNLGTLLDGMHLRRGMKVLDFGAGTCWLSRYLAQMGCATVSVDPSAKALELGRQWFEQHPPAQMPEPAQFLVFDGRRLDLTNESIDRIITFDAFHHVPNAEEVLAEFARVLKPGGMAGFSEPGPFHSRTAQSQMEMREFNVLENDIQIEDLERWGMAAGFTHVWADISFSEERISVKPSQVGRFIRHWWWPPLWSLAKLLRGAAATMRYQHTIYMAKGPLVKDSRWPSQLAHRLSLVGVAPQAKVSEEFSLTIRIENRGGASWINSKPEDVGNVNLALHRIDPQRPHSSESIRRFVLPKSLAAGESIDFEVPITWHEAGPLELWFDLVSEQIAWFEQHGSEPLRVLVEVTRGEGG